MSASDFRPRYTITNAITAALTRIERARGFLEAAPGETIYTPPSAKQVPMMMEDLVHWINTSESGKDLTGWLEFFVEGLATQLTEIVERGRTAIRADVVGREHDLNERQVRAERHLIEYGEIHVGTYEKLCPDVNRRTLQRDLQDMVEKGLVELKKAARQSVYVLK